MVSQTLLSEPPPQKNNVDVQIPLGYVVTVVFSTEKPADICCAKTQVGACDNYLHNIPVAADQTAEEQSA